MGKHLLFENSILQTTDVRLMGPNRFGSAVRCAFLTGATMAWRQSSGIWEVWRGGGVKNAGEGRGYVGTQVLRALRIHSQHEA